MSVIQNRIRTPLAFAGERANIYDCATNFYVIVEDSERRVIGLERDIRWVLQDSREIRVDVLVSTIATASCNGNISKTGCMSEAIDAFAYVVAINVDLNVEGMTELTFHSGRNIERYVRNGYVADRGPRYDVCGTLEFELQSLGISDCHKECGKSHVAQGMKWLLREGNLEICNVTRGYTAYGVGLRQLELCQDPHQIAKMTRVKRVNLSSLLATCSKDYVFCGLNNL